MDERTTGDAPSVLLPPPQRIATLAGISVGTPASAHLANYEVKFRPAAVAVWQGYAAGQGANAASVPITDAVRVMACNIAQSATFDLGLTALSATITKRWVP